MTTAERIEEQIHNLKRELAKLTTSCTHPLNKLTIWPHHGTAYLKCLACGRSVKSEIGGAEYKAELERIGNEAENNCPASLRPE